jgi:hypothetical protein
MVVLQRQHSYMLVDKALRVGSEENKVERFIRWEPPPMGWVRLNTDGSCRENGFIGCDGQRR